MTLHDRDDVVERLQRPLGLDHEACLDSVGAADVVGHCQAAAPVGGHHAPLERRQELLGVPVRERQYRNLQDRRGGLAGQAPGTLGRPHAGGQRIARIERHVGDRAALKCLRRARRAPRIGVGHRVTVVARIRVDDAADRATLVRQLRLEPPPAPAIACDGDLALDINAHALERLVVLGHAVVHVDQRRRDIAIALERDIRRQLVLRAGRRGVAGDRRFGQRRLEALLAQELEPDLDRRRVEHLDGLDLRVPTPVLEPLQRHLGVELVVGRADMVGLGGHGLHPLAHLGRTDRGVELRLEIGRAGRTLHQGRRSRQRGERESEHG
jgi:hypothetical protein